MSFPELLLLLTELLLLLTELMLPKLLPKLFPELLLLLFLLLARPHPCGAVMRRVLNAARRRII